MDMVRALRTHWPEYLIEGFLLGCFMVSACVAVIVAEHPSSPARRAISSGLVRRALVGLAMGVTAALLIYSPWGARSGAHMNPAFTLAFLSLGKIGAWDAVFYMVAQFVGGLAGVVLCAAAMRRLVAHPSVGYVVTTPGGRGVLWAWGAEFVISFVLVCAALAASNHADAAPYAGLVAAGLVAAFILFEAPLSGMSINPARTLASALPARDFRGLWVYFTAPPAAMVLAAQVYARAGEVYCAKLNHQGSEPCLFRCEIGEMRATRRVRAGIQEQAGGEGKEAPERQPGNGVG
jgi:aquaporin Z